VNALNASEDMSAGVVECGPVRWKLFQCLSVAGENAGAWALRDAAPFTVSDEAFEAFRARHAAHAALAPLLRAARPMAMAVEGNDVMRDSYVLLDEKMRFLDCSGGGKEPGDSLLDVGVDAALRHIRFNARAYAERGGGWHEQR